MWLVIEGFVKAASAASATADVAISLAVTAPVCAVSNSTGALQLPNATNPELTLKDYLGAHGISTPGVGNSDRVTSPSLEVTTTISCSEKAIILSVLVEPAPGSVPWAAGWVATQHLVDESSPPVKFFGGLSMLEYEQVSIDGVSAPWSYSNYAGGTTPYSTAFLAKTPDASNPTVAYTANVKWRPTFYRAHLTAKVGNPTGVQKSFKGAARVTVNY
jgi:hypothetical protein